MEAIAAQPCILSDKWGHECGGRITLHHPIGIQWKGMGQKADMIGVVCAMEDALQASDRERILGGMKAVNAYADSAKVVKLKPNGGETA